ncbi:hypothetical protein ADUPG1_004534, partial [Aduncisulcus paluster]
MATCQPKVIHNIAMAASFTIGDVIRNENVAPKGMPDSIKPMNTGTEEHEQKGVTAPRRDA